LKTRVLGLELSSPIGLAAGLDKDATAFEAFAALGFGFVEVGTVTPEPQPGNDPPRLFRLPRDRALINRMGFNNAGVETIRERLARPHRGAVVGANIGKNKLTPNDRALDDYVLSAKSLAPLVDYLVVNVSSPNTPGLRDLQAVESLRPLLLGVKAALAASERTAHVPLLLKISPDLSDADIDAVADLALELSLGGIIATNTTLSRDGLLSDRQQIERAGSGGLSGAPRCA
jgi:dihydroorotate dehydrogenase